MPGTLFSEVSKTLSDHSGVLSALSSLPVSLFHILKFLYTEELSLNIFFKKRRKKIAFCPIILLLSSTDLLLLFLFQMPPY